VEGGENLFVVGVSGTQNCHPYFFLTGTDTLMFKLYYIAQL
jgi:hypothetical protein